MNGNRVGNHPFDHRFHEIEEALRRDDPTLVSRFRTLDLRSKRHDSLVFSLLVIGAVLLGVGIATMSLLAWCAGAAAFVASFLVDTRRERRLDQLITIDARPPRSADRHARSDEVGARS